MTVITGLSFSIIFCILASAYAIHKLQKSNESLAINIRLLQAQREAAHKQIEFLQAIVKNQNRIFQLLVEKSSYVSTTNDQRSQLETITRIAEDSLTREARIRTEITDTLEKYGCSQNIRHAVDTLWE